MAIFVRDDLQGHLLIQPGLYSDSIELLWVTFKLNNRTVFVGAVYHPPKSLYPVKELKVALESSLKDIFSHSDDAFVVLAGDFNQLPESSVTSLGLTLVFGGQTHLGHCLDKLFASEQLYNHTYAFDSLVFNKHKVVLASSDATHRPKKVVTEHRFRLHTPALHAWV